MTLLMLVGHSRSNWTLWCLLNDLHSFNSLTSNSSERNCLCICRHLYTYIHSYHTKKRIPLHTISVFVCGRAFLKMNGMRGERGTESVSVYVCLLVVVVNEMYLFHLIFFWIVFLKFSLCFLLYHMFVISFVHGICPFCTYSDTYKDTHTPLTHIYIFNDFGWVQIRFFLFHLLLICNLLSALCCLFVSFWLFLCQPFQEVCS